MAQVTLHGFPPSSYTWTASAICAAKGIDVDFQAIMPPAHKAPEHLARHPFGKVPAFSHGDFTLYETLAIARYVDEVFDGPALQPADPKARARMEQWISVIDSYLYNPAVPGYIFAYIFPRTPDGAPDTARIEKTLPDLRHTLAVLNDALADSAWLASDAPTLADYFFAPLLLGVSRFPEGKALLEELPNLGRYAGQIIKNDAIMSTAPQG